VWRSLRDGLVLVLGTALRDPDFVGMKASNVGLIRSPRSNDELYGSTTNIASARSAGVDIAIAPDWSHPEALACCKKSAARRGTMGSHRAISWQWRLQRRPSWFVYLAP
jgi:hypothetical protein